MSVPYQASSPQYAALRKRLDETLEKHPELEAYTRPATAGDIADLGKKLDEIAALLRQLVGNTSEVAELKSLLARLLSRSA